MSKFEDLIEAVEEWSEEKGIHEGAWLPQYGKFTEEASEMFDELIAMDYETYAEPTEELKEEMGDVLATLIILAQRVGLDLTECLEIALDKISRRKGKLINGLFVKDE